jgi:hypothetical protein
MNCNICFSNQVRTRMVTCSSCNYLACSKCLERYFDEQTESKCPNCAVVWTREFFSINFKSFLPLYDRMGARKLIETEIALFPQTQQLIPVYRETLSLKSDIEKLEESRSTLRKQLDEVTKQSTSKKDALSHAEKILQGGIEAKKEKTAQDGHVCNCPAQDCRGFILKSNYTCGICSTQICKDCFVAISSPSTKRLKLDDGPCCAENLAHKCSPDDLQTVSVLLSTTRACPKCAVPISKISGCDQMWCTQCHCAFSYRTGEVEKGNVHNPHYFNWLQKQKQADGPPQFDGGCITFQNMGTTKQRFLNQSFPLSKFNGDAVLSPSYLICIKVWLIEMSISSNFDNQAVDVRDNQDLRLKYLNNEITYAQLGQKIQKRSKMIEKVRERNDLKTAFRDSFNGILLRYSQECRSHNGFSQMSAPTLERMMTELESLILFFKDSSENISAKFNSCEKKLFFTFMQPHLFESYKDGFNTDQGKVAYFSARLNFSVCLNYM